MLDAQVAEGLRPWFADTGKALVEELGADSIEVATLAIAVGRMLQDLGKYDAAEPLFRRALEIHKTALGEDHRDTASSMYNLANLFEKWGNTRKLSRCFVVLWRFKKVYRAQTLRQA